jgi:hypothetical protein
MIGFSIAPNRLPHTCGGMGLALFVEVEGYPAFAKTVDQNHNHQNPNHQNPNHPNHNYPNHNYPNHH